MDTGLLSAKQAGSVTRLITTGDWSPLAQWTVLGLCVVVLGLTIWNYRDEPRLGRRVTLISLRVLTLALLLFLFFQPALVTETMQRSRNAVAILIDDSQSMAMPHGEETRTDAIHELLERMRPQVTRWGADRDVIFHRFDSALERLPDDFTPEHLKATGESTHLLEALEALQSEGTRRDLAGIVILSDGVDNGALSARMAGAVGLDRETREFATSLGAPIHVFSFTESPDLMDVGVVELRHNPFAFHMNVSTLEATIRATGLPPETPLKVSLLEEGQPIANRTVQIPKGSVETSVVFEIVPRTVGHRAWTVRVSPPPGDLLPGNNQRHAVIQVIRDRIRVLQICGNPSWDQRFLRNHLKRNPNIDLISFFILINPENMFAVQANETTLIPFPAHELFVEELGGFDLVIFQDFNHGPFQTRHHLFRVRDLIREGGGFLMVGGPRAFSEGGYHDTELAEVLPVSLPPPGAPGATLNTDRFQPRLTDIGRRHPVTRLLPDAEANAALWKKLPDLEGINRVGGLQSGAISLLDHPKLKTASGGPQPILSVMEVERGRSMAFTTDSGWLWSFLHSGKGGSSRTYATFLDNAIRWLIRDPDLEHVHLKLEQVNVQIGNTVPIRIQVQGTDYAPLPDHPVSLTLTRRPSLEGMNSAAVVLPTPSDLRTDAEGVVVVRIPLEIAGIHDVVAQAEVEEFESRAHGILVASDNPVERQVVTPDHDGLGLLADVTGGIRASITSAVPDLPLDDGALLQVVRREEEALWSHSLVLVFAMLLFGLEWWMRQRMGYL